MKFDFLQQQETSRGDRREYDCTRVYSIDDAQWDGSIEERCNFEDNYEEMVIFYGALAEENEKLIKENEELI